jgi:hypothetical protein
MDYGEVLSKAWKIVWKYKVLWIFGVLASLGQGGGGGGGGGSNGSNFSNGNNGFNPPDFRQGDFNFMPPELQQGFENFSNTVSNIPWYVWVMIVLGVLVIGLVFWLLSMVGKIGLVIGTKLADEGEEKLPFAALLSKVWPYFFKFLLLELLICAAGLVLGLVIAIPIIVVAVFTLGIGLICLIPMLIVVGLLVSVLINQAEVALVTDDLGVIDSIKAAWNVFRANFWSYVVMALILGVLGFIAGIIIALPFILVLLPPLIAMAANGFTGFEGLQSSLTASLILCCCLLPIVWLASGILTAYVQSAWTLTYLRLKQPKQSAPVVVASEEPVA